MSARMMPRSASRRNSIALLQAACLDLPDQLTKRVVVHGATLLARQMVLGVEVMR